MNPNDVAIYVATGVLLGVAGVAWLVVRGPGWWRTWPVGPDPLPFRDDGQHEHRYEAVTKSYFGADISRSGHLSGGFFQIVAGYRCRCGKPRPIPRYTAREQIAWGLEYIRERYGSAEQAWEKYAKGGAYGQERNPDGEVHDGDEGRG